MSASNSATGTGPGGTGYPQNRLGFTVVFAAFTMKRGRRQGVVKRFPLYPLSYRTFVARAGVEPATWSSVKM